MDTQTNMTMSQEQKKNNKTALSLGVLSAVMTVVAVTFAVLYFNKPTAKFETVVSDDGKEVIETVTKPDGTVGEIKKPETIVEGISNDYIYIPEWGIKLKKPENFQQLSYTLITGRAEETLNVAGIIHDTSLFSFQYAPEFTNVENGGLGALVRVEKGSSIDNEYSEATGKFRNVFNTDKYNFYYEHPNGGPIGTPDELGIENATMKAIEKMLTENIFEI